MVLNNYWKFLTVTSVNHYVAGQGNATLNSGCTDIIGNTNVQIRHRSQGAGYGYGINFNIREGITVRLGTGTTTPTANDYCLSGDITSSISSLNYVMTLSSDEEGFKTQITVTGQNNGINTITLTEIGLCKPTYDSSPDSPSNYILLTHDLLETPKVVAPGDNFSLTFEWVEA